MPNRDDLERLSGHHAATRLADGQLTGLCRSQATLSLITIAALSSSSRTFLFHFMPSTLPYTFDLDLRLDPPCRLKSCTSPPSARLSKHPSNPSQYFCTSSRQSQH